MHDLKLYELWSLITHIYISLTKSYGYHSLFGEYICSSSINDINFHLPSFLGEENRLVMNDIIEELQNVKSQSRANERKACMTQLIRMSREGQMNVIQDNFRYTIRKCVRNMTSKYMRPNYTSYYDTFLLYNCEISILGHY